MGGNIEDKDRVLVFRTQQGDLKAFRLLVDTYKDKSLSLAVSIVKDRALAEDVAQEAFIKVFTKISDFRFRSRFSTWLYRIVVNTAYNQLKKKRKTVAIGDYEKTAGISTGSSAGNSLKTADQKHYIQRAMLQLTPDEALLLRLFYLCENNLKEIEEITRFSASKIRVTLHRGRKNLKQELTLLLGDEIDHLL